MFLHWWITRNVGAFFPFFFLFFSSIFIIILGKQLHTEFQPEIWKPWTWKLLNVFIMFSPSNESSQLKRIFAALYRELSCFRKWWINQGNIFPVAKCLCFKKHVLEKEKNCWRFYLKVIDFETKIRVATMLMFDHLFKLLSGV